jgi:hypothetical protein
LTLTVGSLDPPHTRSIRRILVPPAALRWVDFVRGCPWPAATLATFLNITRAKKAAVIANEPQALSDFAASLDATCFVVCEATGDLCIFSPNGRNDEKLRPEA